MKKKRITTIRMIIVAAAGVITLSAEAQTAAPGPYYANPSWDQTLPASTRFIVLSNMNSAAVLDRETGLVWERSPSTEILAWDRAHFHCNNLIVGNRKGWRLPTLQEVMSLIDPSASPPGPLLPAGHPFINVTTSLVWSATTNFGDPSHAWGVILQDGNEFVTNKGGGAAVWCIRGGQGVDPQ